MTRLSEVLGAVQGAIEALDLIPDAEGVEPIRRDLYEARNAICALMAHDRQAAADHYTRMAAEAEWMRAQS